MTWEDGASLLTDAKPYSKESQLSRGTRRYRRKVASPKMWQAIIAAKRGPCRVCGSPLRSSYHHLVPRSIGGDDVPANIVPLCGDGTHGCHGKVEMRQAVALAVVAESLSDAEYAYVVGKLGEGGMERLFGVGR